MPSDINPSDQSPLGQKTPQHNPPGQKPLDLNTLSKAPCAKTHGHKPPVTNTLIYATGTEAP